MKQKIWSNFFVLSLGLFFSGSVLSMGQESIVYKEISNRLKGYLPVNELKGLIGNRATEGEFEAWFSRGVGVPYKINEDFIWDSFRRYKRGLKFDRFAKIDFFYECSCCRFNRKKHPERRAFFEGNVLVSVMKNENAQTRMKKDKSLRVTFIGSGQLFSEWVMINKLIEIGFRKISVTFIDTIYKDFLDGDLSKESLKESSDYESALKVYGKNRKPFVATYGKKLYSNCMVPTLDETVTNDMFVQFFRWFENNHEDVVLDIAVYGDLGAYVSNCQDFPENKCDLMIAEDVDDEHINGDSNLQEFLINAYENILVDGGLYGILVTFFDLEYLKKSSTKRFLDCFENRLWCFWRSEWKSPGDNGISEGKSIMRGYVGEKPGFSCDDSWCLIL